MKFSCTRRKSSSIWATITTATMVMQQQQYYQQHQYQHQHQYYFAHNNNLSVLGKWFFVSLFKSTASAILASSHTNKNVSHLYHSARKSTTTSSGRNTIRHLFNSNDHKESPHYDYYCNSSDSKRTSSLPVSTVSWLPSLTTGSTSRSSSFPSQQRKKPLSRLYSTTTPTTAATATNTETTTSTNAEAIEISDMESSVQRFNAMKRIITAAPTSSSTTQSPQQQQQQQHHDRTNTVPTTTTATTSKNVPEVYDISLRLATMSDIASISSCNIQTLPENYNDLFYMNHITEYPYLSFVAVIDEPPKIIQEDTQQQQQRRPIHGNYEPTNDPPQSSSSSSSSASSSQPSTKIGFIQRHLQLSKRRFATTFWIPQQQQQQQQQQQPYGSSYNNNEEENDTSTATTTARKSIVVGYLLGKITSPQEPYQYLNYINNSDKFGSPYNKENINLHHNNNHKPSNALNGIKQRNQQSHEMIGHVSSLAVLPEARRRGLARALLEQFHHHLITATTMQSSSNQVNRRPSNDSSNSNNIVVTSTGLHVRRSNVAAVKLYETLGYIPAVTIPSYYEDGEDAYYMQKILLSSSLQQQETPHNNSRDEETQSQQDSLDFKSSYRLPRIINTLTVCEEDANDDLGNRIEDEQSISRCNHSNNNHDFIPEGDEEDEQMLMSGTV